MDDLRSRIAEALCPPHHRVGSMSSHGPLSPMRPCQLHQAEAETVAAVVQPHLDAEVDAVANRGAAAITAMGVDVRATRAERDRYRAAWQSARFRAQAYGEGILRHVEDRDTYAGWEKQQAQRAHAAEVERDGLRDLLAKTTTVADRVTAERDAALAALQAVREAQSLGEALAAVAKHDGITTDWTAASHACRNCEGVDPDTCLMNPDRTKETQS